jgi:hypothetical protein
MGGRNNSNTAKTHTGGERKKERDSKVRVRKRKLVKER